MNKKIFIAFVMLLAFCGQLMAQELKFDNPLAEKRADPWVWKDTDGTYYFIATAPEYDRIILREAKTINGLKTAEEKVIWTKHETGVMGAHIWAPELHKIDGKWYVYFAAGETENIWNIRMWVLSCKSKNPMKGKWKEEGQVKTDVSSFSLDATVLEHKGKNYLIWAQNIHQWAGGTSLVMAEMKSPTEITGPEIVITDPVYNWERQKYNVNEGPAVIKNDGKIFVAYSASATNHNYCLGLLWIDEDEDIMDVSKWNKSPGPVFYTNEDLKRYGPGHNSFTVSEDGTKTIMIYHARDYKGIQGHELSDPNRATRAREVKWLETGFPDFMQMIGD